MTPGTPWYDLVSVLKYDGFDTELAMAYGEVFSHAEVSAFALADFAARCGVDRKLMRRDGQRLAKLAAAAAAAQAQAAEYQDEAERAFVQGIADFVARQAERLTQLVTDAARWKVDPAQRRATPCKTALQYRFFVQKKPEETSGWNAGLRGRKFESSHPDQWLPFRPGSLWRHSGGSG